MMAMPKSFPTTNRIVNPRSYPSHSRYIQHPQLIPYGNTLFVAGNDIKAVITPIYSIKEDKSLYGPFGCDHHLFPLNNCFQFTPWKSDMLQWLRLIRLTSDVLPLSLINRAESTADSSSGHSPTMTSVVLVAYFL